MNSERKKIEAQSAAELFKKASEPVNNGAKVEKIYISEKKGMFKIILKMLRK